MQSIEEENTLHRLNNSQKAQSVRIGNVPKCHFLKLCLERNNISTKLYIKDEESGGKQSSEREKSEC